jgi:hypothetical protein
MPDTVQAVAIIAIATAATVIVASRALARTLVNVNGSIRLGTAPTEGDLLSRARLFATAVIVAALLAACQSTNRESSGDAAPDGVDVTVVGQDPGGSDSGPDDSGGPPTSGSIFDATTTPAAGAGTGTTRAGGATGTIASGGGPGPTNAPAGGTIVIGVHDDNPATAFSAFGVVGRGASTDQQVHIRNIVKWINDNGGMGGRQVQLVSHITQSINGSFDQQGQAACTALTEDAKSVVVVSGARVPSLTLLDCLARHGVPLVWEFQYYVDDDTYARYAGYLYQPSMLRAERFDVIIDVLAEAKYFDGGTLGIVRWDRPIDDRLSTDVIRPALARHGVRVAEEIVVAAGTGASSAGDQAAASSNGVLRLRSKNVDRVLFLPTHAVLPLVWFPAAEAQGFRPRYAITSLDNPAFQTDNAPPAQLAGAMGVGWLPAGDVYAEQQPPLWPSAQQCVDMTPGVDPPKNGSVRRYCDGLLFLKALFDAGAQPTPGSMRATADRLGANWQSPWTFRAEFGSGRWDGASAVQLLRYDTPCDCWKYSGAVRDAG